MLLLALLPLLAAASPRHVSLDARDVYGPHLAPRGPLNATQISVCQGIQKNFTSSNSNVYFALDALDFVHYTTMEWSASNIMTPSCVVLPATDADVAVVLKAVGSTRTPFAVLGGGHASNAGFSSTTGILLNLARFAQVIIGEGVVDIGPALAWDAVYAALNPMGRNVVGGRVSGIGISGFQTGGGGFSWLSNQYGLTVDTLVSANVVLPNGQVVTASATENSDLFFGIKGAGNRLGVITSYRLHTVTQGQVYGGLRYYDAASLDAFLNATAQFQLTNTDKRAQVISVLNGNALTGPQPLALTFFDGSELPSPSPFAAFDAIEPAPVIKQESGGQTFLQLVQSAPTNLTAGTRALFETVSLKAITPAILATIKSELLRVTQATALRTPSIISYDIEPFLVNEYFQYSQGGAFPHSPDDPFTPLNLYYGYLDPADDSFYASLIAQSAATIKAAAIAQGQQLDGLPKYPNYALFTSTGQELFQNNLAQLQAVRDKYDPQRVMQVPCFPAYAAGV